MNETKRRINEYKARLPRLKERVIAVTLLLAISASMLTTVTFAWLAISTAPEVSGVNTSITSNGNLEIALAVGNDSPFETMIGDGNLPDFQRNNTWGNLVNLSISDYGLDKLVLRPAELNDSGLIDRPLYGPVYDANGRVVDMNTNFGYAKWEVGMNRFTSTTDAIFANNPFGVRAITSMEYGDSSDNADAVKYNEKLNAVEALNKQAQANFNAIANVKSTQDALKALMTGYMIETQFRKHPTYGGLISEAVIKKADLQSSVAMYEALIKSFEEEAYVIAQLLNLQAEIDGKTNLTIDRDTILALTPDTTAKTAQKAIADLGFTVADKGFIANIDLFLKDYNTLKTDLGRLNGLINSMSGTQVKWNSSPKVDGTDTLVINDIILNLAVVGDCRIATEDGRTYNGKISGVGAGVALEMSGKKAMVTITNGILYNFHSFCGGGMETGEYITIAASAVGYSVKIEAKVRTQSSLNYFDVERGAIAKTIATKYGEAPLLAVDTYGFAVDLWLRTNAPNTFLTLQGNVLTETKQEPVMGKDADGNEVYLYVITIKIETPEESTDESTTDESNLLGDLDVGLTQSYDVYKVEIKDDQGNVTETKWYYADNHSEVTPESLGLAEGETIPTPIQKIEDVEYVIGYEGENRVWNGDEHYMLSVNSTTQGSGSCYVFYAESPVDQERSLKLLESMKVAFVNDKGELLATAFMDSKRHYSDAGKCIVPLVLTSDSKNIGTDINGDPMYAITALEQNVATRITAIVYLDGKGLTDDDVLASADIRGKINIQFGSSAALYPLMNEELYGAELIASVHEVTNTTFDYDKLAPGAKMETTVKIAISGSQPSTMTANFIRRINATQGSPEGTFTLTDTDKDGIWEGDCEFLYPGTYILRSVYLDGVERDLATTTPGEYTTVTVNGFSIASVSQLNKTFVMTDSNTYNETLTLNFASDDPDKMPKTVLGKFVRDDGGTVNVNFTYDPTTSSWSGGANFVSSGTYKMQYVLLDGQYVELAESHWREIELVLGMRVNLSTASPTTMIFGDPSTPDTLQITALILDNTGEIIANLANTDLYYAMGGTNRLHTKLTWNSVDKCYYGEFPTQSGTWNFNNVVVRMGENVNTLTRANSNAPVFTVIPPTPPSYITNSTPSQVWLLSESQKALINVTLKEASSATVIAKFVNKDNPNKVSYVMPVVQDGGGYYFTTSGGIENGEEIIYQNFQFAAPEDGLWTLESVSVFNVFGADKQLHPLPEDGAVDSAEDFESGIIFDSTTVSGYSPISIAVLSEKNITTSFDYTGASSVVNKNNKIVTLGKTSSGEITSTFMQNVNVNSGGIKVTFSDPNNLISRGYFDISNVKMSYKYDSTAESYGGYTSDAWNGLKGTNLTAYEFSKTNATNFTLSNNTAVNFQYAAKYTADAISYKVTTTKGSGTLGLSTVNDTNTERNLTPAITESYAIEVFSNKPIVTVSAVTPTGTYNVDTKASGSVSDTVNKVFSHTATKCGEQIDYYDYHIITSILHKKGYVSSISEDKKEATVYFKCDHNEAEGEYKVVEDQTEAPRAPATPHHYEYENGNGVPSVTLTLSNTGNLFKVSGSSAQLNFVPKSGSDVKMYTKYISERKSFILTSITVYRTDDADKTSSYNWTSENGCTRFVGSMTQSSGGTQPDRDSSDSKTAAGTLTGNQLVATYNGATYTFTIDTITINNPH